LFELSKEERHERHERQTLIPQACRAVVRSGWILSAASTSEEGGRSDW